MKLVPLSVPLAALVAIPLPAQTLHPVMTGGGPLVVSPPLPMHRGFAAGRDGRLWAAVHVDDGTSPGDARYHLLLRVSGDGGRNWTTATEAPTSGDGRGAILFDADCHSLHLLWNATNGTLYSSVLHQVFDTKSGAWLGSPTVIAAGTAPEDQYYIADLEVTPRGTVVVAYSTHRTPPPSWNGNWATGLRVRKRGQSAWSQTYQLNTGVTGVSANLLAIGETVHACYRSAFGGYGIYYRAFDTAALQFTTPADVPVGPNGNQNLYASNTCVLARDSLENLYVMYATGLGTPGNGTIHVAYAAAGNYTSWTQSPLAGDPPLAWGNNSYWNYAFAWTGGQVVAAFHAKAAESHTKLYRRFYVGGRPVGPDVTFATSTETDRFKFLAGYRSTQAVTPHLIAIGGATSSAPQGHVSLYADRVAMAVRFGVACQGNLPGLPSLDATAPPLLGGTLSLQLDRLPPSQPGQLLVGAQGFTGIPLDPIGLLGCALHQDLLLSFPLATDPNGRATFAVPLPNPPQWDGLNAYAQALVLAPAPVNALLTNSVGVTLR